MNNEHCNLSIYCIAFVRNLFSRIGPSIKDVQPYGGGGGQTKADGGGRLLNKTSTSEDFEQIFCVSHSEDTPPRPWLSGLFGSQNMLRFRAIRAGCSRMEGGSSKRTMSDREGGFSFCQDVFDG